MVRHETKRECCRRINLADIMVNNPVHSFTVFELTLLELTMPELIVSELTGLRSLQPDQNAIRALADKLADG